MEDRAIERNEEIEIDLHRLFQAVVQKLRLIIVAAAVCGVLAFVVSVCLLKPQYQSAVMFYVNNSSVSSESITSGDIAASKSLVDSYLVILDTETTLTEVIECAAAEHTVSELRRMIEAAAVNETELFRVVVTAEDPREAKTIADAIAHVLPQRIGEIMERASAEVVDAAVTAAEPSAPNHLKNTLLGVLFGLALSTALIGLWALFDPAIKSGDDIAKVTDYPILAAVPYMDGQNDLAASEAYKLLRTKLMHSAAKDGGSQVIGVSAGLRGEGASMTALRLAHAISRLDKAVVLVDCDFHGSTPCQTDGRAGLADYLTWQRDAENLLQPCTLFGKEQAFTMMAAGQTPPNPAELLGSARMETLLTILRNTYDYVILDLPAVGETADAMVVAKETDGILLTVRRDHCDRYALREAIDRLEFMDAKILGIVLNCAKL